MNLRLTVPVYVDLFRDDAGQKRFRVRPLFLADAIPAELDVREDRALKRMADRIRQKLLTGVIDPDHRELLPWTFCPPCTGHTVRLRLDLRKQSLEGLFYVAVFEVAGRRIVVLPREEMISFEWPSDAALEAELSRVLTSHLRRLEKEADAFDAQSWLSGAQGHLTHVLVSVSGTQKLSEGTSQRLSLGQEKAMDGGRELQKVGNCLDSLYPNHLQRALLRETEVEELLSLFARKSSRPAMVLLVGRPKSGKTALIHECVRRRLDTPEPKKRGQFWQVSPQRVISGMSHLGQWEERWTSMLAEMRAQRHIMVLDDVLGLFKAGKTSGSNLSLGHVLKARQEHEPLAILAETTPEGWGRLREMDRSFASMFRVIHVRETGDDITLRILVRTLQTLEGETRVQMAPEVLPLTMRLQQRFGRARSFPGKAVEMLTALANSFADRFVNEAAAQVPVPIQPGEVLRWFASRQGISLSMLDASQTLDRPTLLKFFAQRIMGQHEAVASMVDTVLMARAEVHDVARPLGTLLFLGPTGVGKTECARALAECVFGSEERMIRFDLNEFSGADAALRLIGNSNQSGLLTSKVRRHPFSLLLFDEVEKAHPDVFDLLLQVLGEGRLTDALGQSTDFCNCLILLTSNLGAQKARRRLGFDDVDVEDREVYREAAEKFFRPEFFNRLDRVVPFHELSRHDIEHLAGTLSASALARQGLRDRRVEVSLDEASVRFLAERGYDREYGARALRRAIESHLVEPLAGHLMEWPGQKALQVKVSVAEDTLKFACDEHRQIAQQICLPTHLCRDELLDLSDAAHEVLDAVTSKLDTWKVDDEKSEGITGLRAWYYRLRDECGALRMQLQRTEDSIEAVEKAQKRQAMSRSKSAFSEAVDESLRVMPTEVLGTLLDDLLVSDLSASSMAALVDRAVPVTKRTAAGLRLLWRCRYLLTLCEESLMEVETWTLSANEPEPPWFGELWCRGPFMDFHHVAGESALVVEGHGLAGLVTACCGAQATIQERLCVHHIRAEGAPPLTDEITRIYSGKVVIDLCTGLVLSRDRGDLFELALAQCFADWLEN